MDAVFSPVWSVEPWSRSEKKACTSSSLLFLSLHTAFAGSLVFPRLSFFFYNLGLSNLKFLLAVSGHSSDCLSNKVPCCSAQKIGVFICFNFVLSPSRVLLEHSSFTLTNSLFIPLCDYGHSSTFYPISPFFLPLKDPGWLLLYIQR